MRRPQVVAHLVILNRPAVFAWAAAGPLLTSRPEVARPHQARRLPESAKS